MLRFSGIAGLVFVSGSRVHCLSIFAAGLAEGSATVSLCVLLYGNPCQIRANVDPLPSPRFRQLPLIVAVVNTLVSILSLPMSLFVELPACGGDAFWHVDFVIQVIAAFIRSSISFVNISSIGSRCRAYKNFGTTNVLTIQHLALADSVSKRMLFWFMASLSRIRSIRSAHLEIPDVAYPNIVPKYIALS